MATESADAAAPASPVAPVAPVTTKTTTVSADRPDDAGSDSHAGEASTSEEGGEEAAKPVIKTAEQKELEALRRERIRKERTNARLWHENQELRAAQGQGPQSQPREQQQPAPGQEQSDERVQVTRRDFEAAATERARVIARQTIAEENLATRCNTLLDNGAKLDPKFDQAIVAVGAELPLFKSNGQPTDALEEILESKHAAKIVLHLRDNPDVASELADLSPRQLTRRLIALEAEVAPPTRKVSTAPRPLEPESGTSSSSGEPDVTKNPAAWREWRNKTSKVR